MKTARIIVKENIIKNLTGTLMSDEGLDALNGIYKSPYEQFPDNTHEIDMIESLIEKYKEEFSCLKDYNISIEYK